MLCWVKSSDTWLTSFFVGTRMAKVQSNLNCLLSLCRDLNTHTLNLACAWFLFDGIVFGGRNHFFYGLLLRYDASTTLGRGFSAGICNSLFVEDEVNEVISATEDKPFTVIRLYWNYSYMNLCRYNAVRKINELYEGWNVICLNWSEMDVRVSRFSTLVVQK